MYNDNDIEHMLTNKTPTLTPTEQGELWNAISLKLEVRSLIPSPFMANLLHTKVFVSSLLVFLLVVGGTGTALASNASRPGDLLFPIERALENARLSLAQDEATRGALTAQFTEKRIAELQEIISEESQLHADDSIVAVEKISSTTTSPRVTFQNTPRKKLSEHGEARVGIAVDAILAYLDDTNMSDEDRTHVLKKVFGTMSTLALDVQVDTHNSQNDDSENRTEVKHNSSGESKIEIRSNTERIKIENKEGEVRIQRTRSDDSDRNSNVSIGTTTVDQILDDRDDDRSDDSSNIDDEDSNSGKNVYRDVLESKDDDRVRNEDDGGRNRGSDHENEDGDD